MNYIYFGTSEFATIILEKLIANAMVPIAVVTQPDRPAGRGKESREAPVKVIAKRYDILLLQPQKISDFRLEILDLKPDVCIVAAYGGIIPKGILEIPKHGFVNVHPSLLPKYRGPSPIQTAILNGDAETGVSIMLLDAEVDHGPILMNHESQIMNHETASELEKKLAEKGAELLRETIPLWIAGKIKPVPQNHTKATFTKMMTKDDGHIDWKKSGEEIERHVRAMVAWPGSWTLWERKEGKMLLKIKKVRILSEATEGPPGTVLPLRDDLLPVVCGEDLLGIETLQPQGKKEMSARAFVNGHPDIVNAVLM